MRKFDVSVSMQAEVYFGPEEIEAETQEEAETIFWDRYVNVDGVSDYDQFGDSHTNVEEVEDED